MVCGTLPRLLSLKAPVYPTDLPPEPALMPPHPEYDVAVIGAGPSGSRTAELLASRGFRTALFERDRAAGQPVHCTGIVSTECFERYGLPSSLVIRKVSGFLLRSPSGRGVRLQRDDTQAYILDRVELDRLLADRAADAGAQLVLHTTVDDLQWTGGAVSMRATTNGFSRTVTARAAVVATGYGAPLARKLGLGTVQEVVSGCQAVVEAHDLDEVEVFTGGAFGHGGYGWLVPWRPGYALAGLLTRKHTMRRLDEYMQRLQADGRVGAVQETFRCRAIPLGVPKRTVANGVIGVGDVVSQVKPTSGGGIYYSLLGADTAAEVLAQALDAGDVTAEGLMPYDRHWRKLMEPEIRQGYALRR
ncbi:MAG: NAD(P)/FAD-dependent oxidoreductase, partial [Dehalococcoidia bacterium]